MQQSLLFGERSSKQTDSAIAKKSKSGKKAPATVKGGGVLSIITMVRNLVNEHLGKYKNDYICITDKDVLHDYVNVCIRDNCVAIDTETTGLNPFKDKLVGISLYSVSNHPAYIPIAHVSYITNEPLQGQLPVDIISKELQRLADRIEAGAGCEMFNSPFDIRFLKHGINVYFKCSWDAKLAARLMNENEDSTALKPLHQKYVLDDAEDEFKFGDYFNDIGFDKVPLDIATLYAAHDAKITHELVNFQKQYLYYDRTESFESRNGMNGVSWTFFNIEMPCVEATVGMEESGISIDLDCANALANKYHPMLDEARKKIDDELKKQGIYDKVCPLNVGSSKQLATLFYDVLKVGVIDKKKPRGTGVAILAKVDNPLAKLILEWRTLDKLIGTYIDKLPNCLESDGKIHCNFNQYGADTGRYSSSDPNLQNIPSHNKDIRKMFIPDEGCFLLSADYSQQEPKCLAALCKKDGDSQMYDTFMAGKDIYAEIASKSFHKPYEECLEFNTDRTVNPEGKERRSRAKVILLSILYGKSDQGIAEDLNCSLAEAKSIKASVFRGFPAIKKFERDSLDFAYYNGYVTTVCGRKRRLPDLMLDEYEFKWVDDVPHDSDALDFDDLEDSIPIEIQDKWLRRLAHARFDEKRKIFEQANKQDGVWIIDNGKKIGDATRQCVNSRIQGSAADLTKLAMIDIFNDPILNELGFKLLLQVHDEVIGQCPMENIKKCSLRLAEIMSKAAEKILEMPIKCDVEITKRWYGEKYQIEDICDSEGNLLPEKDWVSSEIEEKESNTSHAMSMELLEELYDTDL